MLTRTPIMIRGRNPANKRRSPVKGILIALSSLLILGATGLLLMMLAAPKTLPAYEVRMGTRELGVIAQPEHFQQLVEEYRLQLCNEYETTVEFSSDISYTPIRTVARYIADEAEVLKAVESFSDIQTEATAVYVDGQVIGATRTDDDANWVYNQILEPFKQYLYDGVIGDLGLVEQLEIEHAVVPMSLIIDKEKLYTDLMIGNGEKRTYTVEKGDSVPSIARQFGMKTNDLLRANPRLIIDDMIFPGDELNIMTPNNALNVRYTKTIETQIELPYKTEVKTDSSMLKTQRKTIQEGKTGLREVVARQEYVNGVMTEETIVSETVVRKAVNQIVAKGTKEVEKKASIPTQEKKSASGSSDSSGSSGSSSSKATAKPSTGSSSSKTKTSSSGFAWPAKGTLTSKYGTRWGRLHAGIDIANSSGTPIYASKSGTVITSGWSSGYGKLVAIDHGGGVVTRYGHNSKLVVKKGQKVDKGDLIAYMGTTGNSTGNHCHFEIRINGKAINPLSKLN